jgi:hypothetical protein
MAVKPATTKLFSKNALESIGSSSQISSKNMINAKLTTGFALLLISLFSLQDPFPSQLTKLLPSTSLPAITSLLHRTFALLPKRLTHFWRITQIWPWHYTLLTPILLFLKVHFKILYSKIRSNLFLVRL